MIRIANAQGFWGDSLEAPIDQVRRGPIDYLTLDYLAEVTMSVLQKQRARDPKAGYARDFVEMIARVLPDLKERRVRVVEVDGAEAISVRSMCYLTLTIDHRALDAFQANAFLGVVVDTLEQWPADEA